MRDLLAPAVHPGPLQLIMLLCTPQPKNKSMVGMKCIAAILQDIFTTSSQMEDPSRHNLHYMPQPGIANSSKKKEGMAHMRCLQGLESDNILRYTDGSKTDTGDTTSACHCVHTRKQGPAKLWFEGKCQLGDQADIVDREIQGIQGGLEQLLPVIRHNECIFLCADNQNMLCALAGRPSSGREYIKKCLEVLGTLRRKGCKVLGKCTPSHQNIPGNEQADKLAKQGLKSTCCIWA